MPKSSIDRLTPSWLQVAQALDRGLAVLDHRVLGQLEVERAGRQRALGQHPLDQELDAALAELDRRQVDRHLQAGRARCPARARCCRQALRSTQAVKRRDQPDVLGQPDELARPDQAAIGMVPAHQRLDPDHPVGRELELRLVVDDELLAGQRLAQLALEGHRAAGGDVHLGGEEAVGVAARLLGPVHGELGVLQQRLDGAAVGRGHGDADAGADVHLAGADHERRGEGLAQPPRQLGRIVRAA